MMRKLISIVFAVGMVSSAVVGVITSPFDGTWVRTTFDLAPGKAYWIEIREAHDGFVWTYGG